MISGFLSQSVGALRGSAPMCPCLVGSFEVVRVVSYIQSSLALFGVGALQQGGECQEENSGEQKTGWHGDKPGQDNAEYDFVAHGGKTLVYS